MNNQISDLIGDLLVDEDDDLIDHARARISTSSDGFFVLSDKSRPHFLDAYLSWNGNTCVCTLSGLFELTR